MSRRRDQRDRRQDDTSDRSKRILQISLVSVGVLLLLVAMVIAVGLPMGTSLLANGGGSGDSGGNGATGGTQTAATTTSESKQTTQKAQTTTTTTEKKTTTTQQTTTTTQQTTTTQKPQNPRNMQVVNKRDRDGDGYVSQFSLSVNVDTTRNEYKNRNLHFIIAINGQKVDTTNRLNPNANGYVINLDKSTLRNYQSKQGSMRVTVKLVETRPRKNNNLKTWNTRVKYEPKENTDQ